MQPRDAPATAPKGAPELPALPEGWTRESDDTDVWYMHADGRTQWDVPTE
jgi:hypothetical protein